MRAGDLQPKDMSKRQRRVFMIQEVEIPKELVNYLFKNDTNLKRSFNRLSAAMVKGTVEMNPQFLQQMVEKLTEEMNDE